MIKWLRYHYLSLFLTSCHQGVRMMNSLLSLTLSLKINADNSLKAQTPNHVYWAAPIWSLYSHMPWRSKSKHWMVTYRVRNLFSTFVTIDLNWNNITAKATTLYGTQSILLNNENEWNLFHGFKTVFELSAILARAHNYSQLWCNC